MGALSYIYSCTTLPQKEKLAITPLFLSKQFIYFSLWYYVVRRIRMPLAA